MTTANGAILIKKDAQKKNSLVLWNGTDEAKSGEDFQVILRLQLKTNVEYALPDSSFL